MRLSRRRSKAARPSDVVDSVSNLLALFRTAVTQEQIVTQTTDLLLELAPADAMLLLGYPPEQNRAAVLRSMGVWADLGRGVIELDRKSGAAEPACRIQGTPLREALRRMGGRELHCWDTTLCVRGRILGSIWLGRSLGGWQAFSPAERRIAGMAADILAAGLTQSGLSDQAQRQHDRLAAVRTVERAVISSMDLSVTLNVFLDQVMEQLRADAAAILLLDPKSHEFTRAASRGFRNNNRPPSRIRVDHSLAPRASLERQTVSLELARPDEPRRPDQPLMRDEEFTAYYAAPLIAHGQVCGVLEVFRRSGTEADPDWPDLIESFALQGAIAIDSTESFHNLQRIRSELALACDSTIEGWSRAVDLHAREAEGHSQRVSELSVRTAERMGIAPDQILSLRRGALLHDIGKLGIPEQILFKPDALTESEWQVMRQHPIFAEHLLEPIEFLRPALEIPKFHHERWDGSGYPYGLAGSNIPLAARIFSVVDVWDSMQAHRPFRRALSETETIEYLRQSSGRQFDPEVLRSFLQILQETEV
jgi:HD-GYP domain-containing protein (c-di-GMP phosphodiesterase class II)